MKIVCESCGAKYSIADDRVVGKMFKIRCKRCSEVIVVRGDQQPAAPAASPPAAASPGNDQSWHVVVEGEQAGPYTPQQLQEMLGRGAIDWETYVWTEGFENWVAMREVEPLVAQLGGPQSQGRAAAAPAASPRARPTSDAFASGQASMGADPFADEPALTPGSDLFSEPRTPASDLFAARPAHSPTPAASFRDGDAGVMVATPAATRAAPERTMTGARNENSVLFSLKNLQALATGSGSGSTPPAAAAPGDRGGYASGEGSGLIDIRALATATGVNDTGKSPAQRDDLLAMGTQGGAFGALASPMLSPATPEDTETTRKSIVWGVVASVALLSLTAVVIVYMIRSPADAPARPIVEPPSAHPSVAEPGAASPAPTHAAGSETAAAPSQAPAVAAPPVAAQQEAEHEPMHASAEHTRRHGAEGSSAKDPAAAKAAGDEAPKTLSAAVAAPAAKTRTKAGPQTLDELLDGALTSGGPKPGGDAVAPPANLPETPTREEVLTAMGGVKSAVQQCSAGGGDVATVTVNVAGATGHVTNAQVAGVAGPEGSCIAQAVRKASFPRFAQKVFKVTFPYKL